MLLAIRGVNHTFSPKLCLELLPKLTDEQIQFEVEHFKTYNQNLNLRQTTVNPAAKRAALDKYFKNNIVSEFKTVVKKYTQLTDNISCLLEEANGHLDEIRYITSAATTTPQPADSPTQLHGK